MNVFKHHCILAILLLFGAVAVPVAAFPGQPLPPRHWELVQGDNIAEASSQGIHVDQRSSADVTHFASATAKLVVANAHAWKVSFDVRFGTLRPAGAMVRLYKGDTVIGWVGADVWYKNFGIASSDQNFKLTVPADTQWHHVEYVSDGTTVSIFHNGQKVGEDASQGAPDHIFVGSTPLGKGVAAQQTEVSLRDVHEETEANGASSRSSVSSKPNAKPQSSNSTSGSRMSLLTLQHQVEDYDDLLTRAQEAHSSANALQSSWFFYMDLENKASPTDAQIDKKNSEDARTEMDKQTDEQRSDLRKAMAMRSAILAAPEFATMYHETRICLPPEEIPTDMPEAQSLRFVEKRD